MRSSSRRSEPSKGWPAAWGGATMCRAAVTLVPTDRPDLPAAGNYTRQCNSAPDRRLHVRALDAGQSRLVTHWAACSGRRVSWRPEHDPAAWHRSGHHRDMETVGLPDFGVCVAVDVHYPRTGGARAAAVRATDAAFAHVLAELFVTAAGMPRRRGGRPGPAHGRPVPPARRTAPRRHPRADRSARAQHDRPTG